MIQGLGEWKLLHYEFIKSVFAVPVSVSIYAGWEGLVHWN